MQASKGIIVTSAWGRTGKTLVCTGLAGSMLSIGLAVEAVKPLSFGTVNNDLKYFVQVTKRQPYYNEILVENWRNANKNSWIQLVKACKNMVYPVLMELPACVSTPLCSEDGYFDATDLSKELNWPIILVVDAMNTPYERAAQALAFLRQKEVKITGFVFNCLQKPDQPVQLDEEINQLIISYGVTCLGVIPYSPSVNTDEFCQGNNIKLIQQNVDLHPVQTTLDPILIQ